MPEHEHAVKDGRLLRVSPSQLHTWFRCRRAWWYDKVARLPRKTFAAQQVGTEVHAQLEQYLRTGAPAVLGCIARAGKDLLPVPGPDLLIEQPIAPLTIDVVDVDGYIDLVNPRGLPGIIEVLDHKTSSNIERYAKTPEQLRQDPQCIMYLWWAAKKFCRVNHDKTTFRFSHVYYQTKGAVRALKVSVDLCVEELCDSWTALSLHVLDMRQAATETDPLRVACDREACSAYGGCPYQSSCADAPNRRNIMSLMDLISKTPATPPATPPPAVSQTAGGSSLVITDEEDAAVLPPDASADASAGITPEAVAMAKDSEKVVTDDSAQAHNSARPRGRPPKPENVAKRAAASAAKAALSDAGIRAEVPVVTAKVEAIIAKERAAVAAPPPAPAVAPSPPPLRAQIPVDGLRLYVNCVPNKPFTDLSGYVQELASRIAKTCGVDDIRVAADGPLAFGKWQGVLAALVREEPPHAGRFVAYSSQMTDPVIEVLAGLAEEVVRG